MKKAILPLIFLIISLVTLVVLPGFIVCMVFAILAAICCIVNIRSKNIFIFIILGTSVCAILEYIYLINTSKKIVSNVVSSAQIESYKRTAELMETNLEIYFYDHEFEEGKTYIVTDTELAEKTTYQTTDYCKGYVVATPSNKEYKGYVSCGKYESEGYDEEIYKANYNTLN